MSIELKLPDDLSRRFGYALDKMDDIAAAALAAGGEKLEAEIAARLTASLSKARKYPKRGTGELKGSLGVSPMRIYKGAYDVRIGYREPRRVQAGHRIGASHRGGGYYNATNAMVGNILEHGHGGAKGGQQAAPYFQKGLNAGKNNATEEMRRVVEARLNEIFN